MLDQPISPVYAALPVVGVLSLHDIAERLNVGPKSAGHLMRKMRHRVEGEHIWTTEEWLAEWLAAESVPQMNWPTPGTSYDMLQEVIISRAIQLVGEMAARGKIRVIDPGMVLRTAEVE